MTAASDPPVTVDGVVVHGAEPWHTLDRAAVEGLLASGPSGLSTAVARQRLTEVGANEVETEREEPWWELAVEQLRDPLIYILLVACAVTLALRDFNDTGVILAVVIINSTIGFVQERRARQAVRALARLSTPRAQVVRDGTPREVASRDLVPGDLVLLTSGALVPADLRLVDLHDLAVDESLLTGESETVDKTIAPLADPTLIPGDQSNMAFGGTTVVRGRGRGIVVRTGAATELGRIAHAMRTVGRTATPLEEAFASFGRRVGLVIVGLAAVVLVIGLARAMPPAEIFLTAVALAVSAIPEGLPVVLTITLAVGVRRMARRHAIVRALPAVETLGSTTVVGCDKTGTLTRNEMTVRTIWAGGERYDVTGTGYAPAGHVVLHGRPVRSSDAPALQATLRAGVLANEVDADALERGRYAGDPTEIALIVAAMKGGDQPAALRREARELDLLPFESERGFMVSLRDAPAHRGSPPFPPGRVEYAKGAPELVLARCHQWLDASGEEVALDRETALAAAAALASEGLRVLALAYRASAATRITSDTMGDAFVLAGLAGIEDPIRPEAVAAVADAHAAGIRVLILTGDHVGTARAVGRRVGLGDEVLSGQEVDRLTDEDLAAALREVKVYARVTPEHKLRIVRRLQAAGDVVAVTGDGVNDAPALRAAHLGIAMGATGSDVAREASDIVLADDNFTTITGAIREGRIAFANIRKATFFLLSTAAGEVLSILVALLAGWPLPFTAAQILWINLVTDSLEVMALSFEPGEPGLLRQPPRPPREGVLTPRLFLRIGGVGVILAAATLAMFWWTLRATGDMTTARTVAVTQMVVMQFYHVFNCRSLDRSAFRVPLLANPFLFVSMLLVTGAHLAALYVPFLQRVLRTTALDGTQWLLILAVGLVVVAGAELDKLVNRATRRRLG